jgi:hypothetical protein
MAFEDLLKDSSFPLDNKNYFNLTITDLNINETYPLQFRWKYENGSFGPWSAVKIIVTPGESSPATPSTLTVTGGAGILTITWNGKDNAGNNLLNIDRIDIYIDGAPFDSTKPADSLFSAGTKTIVAPAGVYIVAAYAVSKAGTKSAINIPVTRTVTSNVPSPASSVTPSTPTVTSVLGAIQLSWDGKTSTGADQPYGFDAAKVYVGTSAGFTPSSSNQVETLNFANGQNTLNIGVGTIVNEIALTYGTDYYVKIATTNGTDTSTPVSATGNPVQIGKVTSGDIVTITADKIATGTLSSGSTITVGSTSGKHVVLSGTGDPLAIYGTGGVSGGAILSFNGTKLSIIGDGTFSGNLAIGSTSTASVFKAEPATGIWLGDQTFASAPFNVSVSGVIKANSGTIGGWTLAGSYLENSTGTFQIHSADSAIYLGSTLGSHIKMTPSQIAHFSGPGTLSNKFTLTTSNGALTLSGTLSSSTINSSEIYGSTITSTSTNSGRRIVLDSSTNAISFYNASNQALGHIRPADDYSGIIISSGGSATTSFSTSAHPKMLMYSSGNDGQFTLILNNGTAGLSISSSGGVQEARLGATNTSTAGVVFTLREIGFAQASVFPDLTSINTIPGATEGQVVLTYS